MVPLAGWVALRRAENLARDYSPNMDPGIVFYFALIFIVPILFVCILAEALRLVFGGQPLSLRGAFAFGLFVVAPVVYSFTWQPLTPVAHGVLLAAQIALFYAMRAVALRAKAGHGD